MNYISTLHIPAILTLSILYSGYVQQQEFPEGDFLLKQAGRFLSKQGVSTTTKALPIMFVIISTYAQQSLMGD